MKTKVSKALQEVWEMKDAAYEETKHLSGPAYFKYIHEQVKKSFPPAVHARKDKIIKSAGYKNPPESALSQAVAKS